MSEYNVLVYRVDNGYRIDEFIYSRPFEQVVNDYITSSNDIVDVKVKDRVTVLTYSDDMIRCIVDSSKNNNWTSAAKFENDKTKNEKVENDMIKTTEKRKEKFLDMMGSHNHDNVLSHDDMVKIYDSVSLEYDTLGQLEGELDDYTRYNCLTFDTCLASHVRVLLDGLAVKEVLEHVTGQYGYIELYYLNSDSMYAMVTM